MALKDLLGEHGVDVADRRAVFELLLRLPLVPRARVVLWYEYANEQGFTVTEEQRSALSS